MGVMGFWICSCNCNSFWSLFLKKEEEAAVVPAAMLFSEEVEVAEVLDSSFPFVLSSTFLFMFTFMFVFILTPWTFGP